MKPLQGLSFCVWVFALTNAGIFWLAANCVSQPQGTALPNSHPFSKAAIADAEKLIKNVFKAEYDKAKTDRDGRLKLAKTLLNQSKNIKDDDEIRYVALIQSRDLAASAGDSDTAFAAIATLAGYHKIDALQMKVKALVMLLKVAKSKEQLREMAQLSLKMADTAAENDRVETAVELNKLAETAAERANDADLVKAIADRKKVLIASFKEFLRIKPYLEKLRTDPEDPSANLEVGKLRCFVRDQWNEGLPLLAKGSDAALQAIAKTELELPKQGTAQAQLAGQWWDLGQKHRGELRTQMLRRSFQWYQRAVFQLDGLGKRQAQARLKALTELLPASLRITDIAVEKRRFDGHAAEVLSASFSQDGRYAVSACADRTIKLWDLSTGREIRTFKGHIGNVFSASFALNGRQIVSASEDRSVRLWNVADGKELRRFAGPTDTVNSVTISPDNKIIAAGGQDRTIFLWEAATGKKIRQITGHRGAIFRIAFSPDGKSLATCSDDQTARVWSLDGKENKQFVGHAGQVLGIAWSPDGKRILTCGEDRTIRQWDAATGKQTRNLIGHSSIVGAVAYSPDGLRCISAGDDKTVRLWNVKTGELIRVLQGHTDAVYGVAFSPDGRFALSCSLDRTIRLWGEKR